MSAVHFHRKFSLFVLLDGHVPWHCLPLIESLGPTNITTQCDGQSYVTLPTQCFFYSNANLKPLRFYCFDILELRAIMNIFFRKTLRYHW
jgi:hypothetical protein